MLFVIIYFLQANLFINFEGKKEFSWIENLRRDDSESIILKQIQTIYDSKEVVKQYLDLEDIEEYNRIMKGADKVVYTSQDYYNGCMHKRNRHLVDNSSRCICFLTEKTGGTFYTVNYASEHGLTIFNIAK